MKRNLLKIRIALFFGNGIAVICSLVMFIRGSPEYFALVALCFVTCLALYSGLKDEFEKMQEEYEEAGTLKKTVKKWRGDSE